MKIMIVDDSTVVRNKIERAVAGKDIEVVAQAEDGEQAIQKYRTFMTDLVTLDITMPNMDGLECLGLLLDINPEVRVLVISALADKATGIEALTKGASGFLCKPFNDAELTEALYELAGD